MNESWWERPLATICNLWWLILGIIIVALALYFTRDLWLVLLTA